MQQKRNVMVGGVMLALIAALWTGQAKMDAAAAEQRVQAPIFEVDPLWPQPLPNHWLLGSAVGVGVDSRDHVFVIHRRESFNERTEIGAATDPPTGSCCIPAPNILEFDPEGNLVNSWGGPGEGYDWPTSNHGLSLDAKDKTEKKQRVKRGSEEDTASRPEEENMSTHEQGTKKRQKSIDEQIIAKTTALQLLLDTMIKSNSETIPIDEDYENSRAVWNENFPQDKKGAQKWKDYVAPLFVRWVQKDLAQKLKENTKYFKSDDFKKHLKEKTLVESNDLVLEFK